MNPIVTRFVRICTLCTVILIVAGILATANAGTPLPTTNTITGIKFAEKYSRSVKFLHLGPILGHHYDFIEKGAFNLQFIVSLEGVDTSKITVNSEFLILVESIDGTEFTVFAGLDQDPKFETGGTKAKIAFEETIDGKVTKIATAQIAIDPLLALLRVSFKGKSGANYRDGNLLNEFGPTVFADDLAEGPGGVILEDATVHFAMTDGNGDPLVVAVGPMSFAGEVRATPQTDPEMGTFNATKIGLAGASPLP